MATRTRTQKTKLDLTKPFSLTARFKEIGLFFQKKDAVYLAMRRLVNRLEKAKIPYAIVGGMAVNAHKHERTTKDVDVLLTSAGFNSFLQTFVPKKYSRVPGRPKRFVDCLNKVSLDILVTGLYPGNGQPGPIVYPDPETVQETIEKQQFVNLATLIELKLAARRFQDFADVVNLIRYNHLDESFLKEIHPSLSQDFIECLEEKRREEEYEARP